MAHAPSPARGAARPRPRGAPRHPRAGAGGRPGRRAALGDRGVRSRYCCRPRPRHRRGCRASARRIALPGGCSTAPWSRTGRPLDDCPRPRRQRSARPAAVPGAIAAAAHGRLLAVDRHGSAPTCRPGRSSPARWFDRSPSRRIARRRRGLPGRWRGADRDLVRLDARHPGRGAARRGRSAAARRPPRDRPGPLRAAASLAGPAQVEAVDHRALFRGPRSSIHHGGAGTTHAVAAAGVPSVVVPHVGDQRYWADRLHRLGRGTAAGRPQGARSRRAGGNGARGRSRPGTARRARALAARLTAEDGVGRQRRPGGAVGAAESASRAPS